MPLPKGVLAAARGRRSKRRTATRVKALNSRRLLLICFGAKTGAKTEPVLIQHAIKIDVGKGFETRPVFDRFLVAKMVPRRAVKSALVLHWQ